MSSDSVGDFSGYQLSKTYLHLAIGHLTRLAFGRTSSTRNASDFITLIQKVRKIKTLSVVLTDHYGSLTSKEFSDFITSKNIKLLRTPLDCPQSIELAERLNQNIVTQIKGTFYIH